MNMNLSHLQERLPSTVHSTHLFVDKRMSSFGQLLPTLEDGGSDEDRKWILPYDDINGIHTTRDSTLVRCAPHFKPIVHQKFIDKQLPRSSEDLFRRYFFLAKAHVHGKSSNDHLTFYQPHKDKTGNIVGFWQTRGSNYVFVVYPRLTPAANTTYCGIEKSGTSWIDYQRWLKSVSSTGNQSNVDSF